MCIGSHGEIRNHTTVCSLYNVADLVSDTSQRHCERWADCTSGSIRVTGAEELAGKLAESSCGQHLKLTEPFTRLTSASAIGHLEPGIRFAIAWRWCIYTSFRTPPLHFRPPHNGVITYCVLGESSRCRTGSGYQHIASADFQIMQDT
jgi:hypothetical protein